MLTTGECFTDLGADYFQRRRDPQREADRLVRQLHALGFKVSLTGTPTPAA
jgi:transposase